MNRKCGLICLLRASRHGAHRGRHAVAAEKGRPLAQLVRGGVVGLNDGGHGGTGARGRGKLTAHLPLQAECCLTGPLPDGAQVFILGRRQVAELAGYFEERVHFSERTKADAQAVRQFLSAISGVAFGDVGRSRHGGTLQLCGEAVPLVCREPARNAIDLARQLHAVFPGHQPSMCVHFDHHVPAPRRGAHRFSADRRLSVPLCPRAPVPPCPCAS